MCEVVRVVALNIVLQKIYSTFFQILQLAQISFDMQLPRVFMQFLEYFHFVNFNLFDGISGDCLVDADYLDGVVMATAGPLVVALLLLVAVISLRRTASLKN